MIERSLSKRAREVEGRVTTESESRAFCQGSGSN